MLGAVQRRDLSARVQGDARIFLDATDQVARHAFRQSFRAHQHVHMPAAASQKNGGLAGRISPADDDDFLVFAKLGLEMSGRVIDAGADEVRQVRQRRFAIFRAGGDDDGAGLHDTPIR